MRPVGLRSAALFFGCVGVVNGALACSYAWDEFKLDADAAASPVDGGGRSDIGTPENDGATPPADGGSDAPACTPRVNCLTTTTTCARGCGDAGINCFTKCAGDASCQTNCINGESQCRDKCAETCLGCTTDGGCPAPSTCTTTSQAK